MKHLVVADWRDGWKWASVWAGIAIAAWGMVPGDQQKALLAYLGLAPEVMPFVGAMLVLLGRFWSQEARPIPPAERGL